MLTILLSTVPAIIFTDQSNVTVVEGQSVNITCQASGDPPPLITWYEALLWFYLSYTPQYVDVAYYAYVCRYDRNGDLLVEQGNRISISNGMVTFSPATKPDEGIFTCVATNNIRNSSADILLRVLGK